MDKWQVTATPILTNILPTMSDGNLNLKPKPGIWLYTCPWVCLKYLPSSHGWIKILVVYIIFRILYIFERWVIFKLWQNPSAVLCQTSTTNTLTGGTSTFTPLLFWSLGVSCRQLADEHMWDLPGMEITWWRGLPEMEFTWWNEALPTDSNAAAAAAAAAKLSNLPTP